MNDNLRKLLELKNCTVSVLPHDNADVDAILSSVMFSKLLDFLGVSNEILIFDTKISKDTLHVLGLLGIDISEFIVQEEVSERNLFLLDHYKTLHKGKVVGCFDHHPNLELLKYDIYVNKHTCATACIVFDYVLDSNMPITRKIVEMLAYAMLVDTTGFLSSKTVKEETLQLPKLLEQYDLDFEKIREVSCLYTDIQNMSIDEIIANGLKTYNFKKGQIKASYVQLKNYTKDFNSKLYNDIVPKIQNVMLDENIAVWVYMIYDLEENMTYVVYIYQNSVISLPYDGIISRGNDIMPQLEKKYN